MSRSRHLLVSALLTLSTFAATADCPPITFGPTLPAGALAVAYSQPLASDFWVSAGSLTGPRAGSGSATLPDGQVIVVGDSVVPGNTDARSPGAQIFNPATGVWTNTGSLNTGRAFFGTVPLLDGRVLVAGGTGSSGVVLSNAEVFTPATGTWTTTGSLQIPRQDSTFTRLADGRVLVAGGLTLNATNSELYDPSTGLWTLTGAMLAPRITHTAVLLTNGDVLATGGNLGTAELYDPTTGQWTATGSPAVSRVNPAAVLLGNGKVLVVGGGDASAELYDPVTETWTNTTPMLALHSPISATRLNDGSVLVVGFSSGNDAEIYHPDTETWITTAPLSLKNHFDNVALLNDGRVLVVGTGNHSPVIVDTAAILDASSLGARPYTYAVTGGSLPDGFTLSSNGVLSGFALALATNTFTVTATDANGCTGSTNCTLAITGSGVADSTAPTSALVSPKNNSRVPNTNSVFTVTGTTKDNTGGSGVALAFYSINGTAYQLLNTSDNYAHWTTSVPLHVQTNWFVVKTLDYQGNQSVLSNRIYLVVMQPFTILTNGVGTLSSTVTAFGTPTNGAALEIGKVYQVTAKPATDYMFSNWLAFTGSGPTNLASAAAKYAFTMQSNLTLIANFALNSSLAVTGIYNGLFYESPTNVTHRTAGFVSLALTGTQGKPAKFTGKLMLDGDSFGFSGAYGVNGVGTLTKPIDRTSHSKSNLTVQLDLPANGIVTGTISDPADGWTSSLSGVHVIPTSAYSGNYTMVLPGGTNDTDFHGGDGVAIATISTTGVSKAIGNLGDGTVFAQSGHIGVDGQWPFYVAAYKDAHLEFQGSILGWLTVTNNPKEITGTLTWNKTALAGGTLYPDGFSALVPVVSSGYTNSGLSGNRVITLTGGSNGVAILDGGNLPLATTNLVTLSTQNKFTAAPTNTAGQLNKLTLSVAAASGRITGTFRPDGVTSQRINSVILQNTNQVRGYFLATTNTGSFLLQGQ